MFDDAVATQDTVTQLVAAMRKVARGARRGIGDRTGGPVGLFEARQAGHRLGRSRREGEAGVGSGQPAFAVLAELCGEVAPVRDESAADALGLLALVAGQDVEPAVGSDGADGRWRIARRVARIG